MDILRKWGSIRVTPFSYYEILLKKNHSDETEDSVKKCRHFLLKLNLLQGSWTHGFFFSGTSYRNVDVNRIVTSQEQILRSTKRISLVIIRRPTGGTTGTHILLTL